MGESGGACPGGMRCSPWVKERQVITCCVNHAARYYSEMIKSFKCADTAALHGRQRVRRFVSFEAVARRKLRPLELAARLEDLRVPPGNRLEALKADRVGQHSIRVNDQWRVCFRWTEGGAEDVEIVDYH
jgi:proteic killer suppression protein